MRFSIPGDEGLDLDFLELELEHLKNIHRNRLRLLNLFKKVQINEQLMSFRISSETHENIF